MLYLNFVLKHFLLTSGHRIVLNCCLAFYIEGRKEMLYLTTHSTHFIYSYMASDIW